MLIEVEGDGWLLPIVSCSENFKLTDYIVPPCKDSCFELKDEAENGNFQNKMEKEKTEDKQNVKKQLTKKTLKN